MNLRILLMTMLILTLIACDGQAPDPKIKDDPPVKVEVITVGRADIADTLAIFGALALRQEANLASQFDGRLTDFKLLPGNTIKREQQVGMIIPAMREALLQSLKNLPESAQLDLKGQMQPIPLTSPINGEVLVVYLHSGDVVQKGEHIAKIGDLSVLDVRADLPLRYIQIVKNPGQVMVKFIDFPHPSVKLPLEALVGQADIEKQTIMMRLKLNNSRGEFRPGMMVKIFLPIAVHKQAVIIPRRALVEEEGVFSVFKFKNAQVNKQTVQVGIFQDEQAEILAGLTEGDIIVTKKAFSLVDGMGVQVR